MPRYTKKGGTAAITSPKENEALPESNLKGKKIEQELMWLLRKLIHHRNVRQLMTCCQV